MYSAQSLLPVAVVGDGLGNVGGHGGEVDLDRRQNGCISVEPMNPLGAGFRPRDRKRSAGGVGSGDLDSPGGQEHGERPRPTADIQDPARAQVVGDTEVDIQVSAIGVKGVIDARESRMFEDVISHAFDDRREQQRDRRAVAVSGEEPHTVLGTVRRR